MIVGSRTLELHVAWDVELLLIFPGANHWNFKILQSDNHDSRSTSGRDFILKTSSRNPPRFQCTSSLHPDGRSYKTHVVNQERPRAAPQHHLISAYPHMQTHRLSRGQGVRFESLPHALVSILYIIYHVHVPRKTMDCPCSNARTISDLHFGVKCFDISTTFRCPIRQ